MKLFIVSCAFAAVLAMLALSDWPRCRADSPKGPRIASVMIIEGCQ